MGVLWGLDKVLGVQCTGPATEQNITIDYHEYCVWIRLRKIFCQSLILSLLVYLSFLSVAQASLALYYGKCTQAYAESYAYN